MCEYRTLFIAIFIILCIFDNTDVLWRKMDIIIMNSAYKLNDFIMVIIFLRNYFPTYNIFKLFLIV